MRLISHATGQEHRHELCRAEDCQCFPCRVYKQGYAAGYATGHAAGYAAGEAAGYAAGYAAGANGNG